MERRKMGCLTARLPNGELYGAFGGFQRLPSFSLLSSPVQETPWPNKGRGVREREREREREKKRERERENERERKRERAGQILGSYSIQLCHALNLKIVRALFVGEVSITRFVLSLQSTPFLLFFSLYLNASLFGAKRCKKWQMPTTLALPSAASFPRTKSVRQHKWERTKAVNRF
jgi:hypothetical protein